ncbi:MAG TPA: tyrosine-type recombinase/integrase [Rhizomicrobium sp.]|jgi:integrase|nr:tyrosine-type recombinase/integrase [Rhizomicrobium sp.]
MNQLTPEFLEKSRTIFRDNLGTTLQDVRDRSDITLTRTARRDALCALDAMPKLFGRDLSAIQASWPKLRSLFASKNAAQIGISEKRYANIRSEVLRAVRAYGVLSIVLTKRLQLSPSWTRLLALVDVPDYCSALKRLACFCTAMGTEPSDANQATLLGFYEALCAEEVVKDPRVILHNTISYWNMHLRKVPGWPPQRMASPFPSTRFMRPLEGFPVSFQEDTAKWQQRLLATDILDFGGPTKALRPVTIDLQSKLLRRFASALVQNSILRMDQVQSLSVLVKFDIMKAGLKIFIGRAGGKSTGYVRQYAGLLLSIARHYCKLSPDEIKSLSTLVKRLGAKRSKGMTIRNRERLTQFDDPAKIRALLTFPEAERARGLKVCNPYRQAKYIERALSSAILLYASVRMKNLHTIRLDRNIRWNGDTCILSFDETEMKNSRPLELELPKETGQLLREYETQYRPRLAGSHGPYLFPGRNGGPRHPSAMRSEFKKAVRKHTGILVNPHLMRHITAKLAIDHDPALLPAISQRLGHASRQTAMDYYLSDDSRSSSRVLNGILKSAALSNAPDKR